MDENNDFACSIYFVKCECNFLRFSFLFNFYLVQATVIYGEKFYICFIYRGRIHWNMDYQFIIIFFSLLNF